MCLYQKKSLGEREYTDWWLPFGYSSLPFDGCIALDLVGDLEERHDGEDAHHRKAQGKGQTDLHDGNAVVDVDRALADEIGEQETDQDKDQDQSQYPPDVSHCSLLKVRFSFRNGEIIASSFEKINL